MELAVVGVLALLAYCVHLAYTAWNQREAIFHQQRLMDQQAWLSSQAQTIDYCGQLYSTYVATAHEMVKCALQDPNAQILHLPQPSAPEPTPAMGAATPPVMHDPTPQPSDPDTDTDIEDYPDPGDPDDEEATPFPEPEPESEAEELP